MNDVLKQVATWVVIATMGYAIASMQDRYTASTAFKDRAEMREYIKTIMNNHLSRGPHDEVAERLLVLELGQKAIIERLQEIKMNNDVGR